ncbi:protein transport protein HofC [Budvicia diplopodorum]|uniref:protein transport protein HofC n=1 Tax=Budvicia diplopodorum TaxID=1119056 RepID=UPI0013596D56|nr:protein transport protein HofC [Budvicia diplopodorum]
MKYARLFIWQDFEGRSGEIPAHSLSQARQLLMAQGVIPVRIKPDTKLTHRQWQLSALSIITRQLATLLQAGLPLNHCLNLIASEHPQAAWRYVLKALQLQISQGKSFSLALTEYPEAFPPLFRELITTGELTGKLDRCCFLLAKQQEKTLRLQQKVRKALSYPLFVLAVALLVSLLMLILVLPAFTEIYQSFDAPLPYFTQSIISLSEVIQDYGLILLAIAAGLYGYYVKTLHPQQRWKEKEQKAILYIPLGGKLIQTNILARIFRTLSMTQSAGIPLTTGIKSAANTSGNIHYYNSLTEILRLIEQGTPLFKALQQQYLFPPLSNQLIRAGEESGMLDTMLDKLADIYEADAENQAENLSAKVEPMLMALMAIIVGGLVIAIYLPIFQLGNVMG